MTKRHGALVYEETRLVLTQETSGSSPLRAAYQARWCRRKHTWLLPREGAVRDRYALRTQQGRLAEWQSSRFENGRRARDPQRFDPSTFRVEQRQSAARSGGR